MKKIQLLMKINYVGLVILEISNIVMYEFWYDYMKPKYREQGELCYMDTNSFIVYIKDVETRFDTSNYELVEKIKK